MRKIPARKTLITVISLDEAKEFTQEHHRQGMALVGKNPQCFALTHENEIVAVVVFCNPRTRGKQRRYTTELFRLTFKKDIIVQGGASKLIRHYMSLPKSADLFTYQDTAGKASDVYEKAGMRLVGKKYPTKEILVKDGLTATTANNNRSDWFSLEQATLRGPDALIATALGEVFEDGKRVSNVELFKRNGYHLETIPGDRLYEWQNPSLRYYTYKITSSVDESYYYGRRRTFFTQTEEMLHDGYMGSGGLKFKNWMKKVGIENLRKEILSVYSTWAEVVKAEEDLIGDKYKTDARCKNSKPGGVGLTGYFPTYTEEICPVHGLTKFRGGCKKCSADQAKTTKICSVHGMTLHTGNSCYKCTSKASWKEKECLVHGITLHKGNACARCTTEKFTRIPKECMIHGVVLHSGNKCLSCNNKKAISIKNCKTHGATTHVGHRCKKCMGAKTISKRTCEIHGETAFKGDTCCKCSTAKIWSVKLCEIHGKTSYRSGKCEKCRRKELTAQLKASEEKKSCSVHGLTAHLNGKCKRCKAQEQISIKICPLHGETKFNGPTCGKCAVKKIWTEEECSLHGMTKYRSGRCMKCSIIEKKSSE